MKTLYAVVWVLLLSAFFTMLTVLLAPPQRMRQSLGGSEWHPHIEERREGNMQETQRPTIKDLPSSTTALPTFSHAPLITSIIEERIEGNMQKTQRPTIKDPSLNKTALPTFSHGPLITSINDLKKGRAAVFVFIVHVATGRLLARPYESKSEDSALLHEKVWRMEWSSKYSAWTFMSHTQTYLTCELGNKVSVDRPRARSFEQWLLHFSHEGSKLFIQSRRNRKLLGTYLDGRSVWATRSWEPGLKEEEDADYIWQMYTVTHCDSMKTCWKNSGTVSLPPESAKKGFTIPLFGSPKPIETDAKKHITLRTWSNWAALPQVRPVVFASDAATLEAARQQSPHIHVIDRNHFEEHPTFGQPTYRGLFWGALEHYPNASVVAYSNSDILYADDLVESVHAVADYFDRKVMTPGGLFGNWKGWMMVGQRVNVDIPDSFSGTNQSELNKLAQSGEVFQTNAEDYFIVSRGLFDWRHEIPDFVVGGVAFDNWIVARANRLAERNHALVVDATKTITAIHQNHGEGGEMKSSHDHPKSAYNTRLAATHGGFAGGGKVTDAEFRTERRKDGRVVVLDKHRLLYE